jgi:hypothetical protein
MTQFLEHLSDHEKSEISLPFPPKERNRWHRKILSQHSLNIARKRFSINFKALNWPACASTRNKLEQWLSLSWLASRESGRVQRRVGQFKMSLH